MKRIHYVVLCTFLVFIFSAFTGCVNKETIEQGPNFIIILTDDQGYNDLSCYGSEMIRTPRIDKLAEQGIRFTNYYNTAPLCGPSRASLLTGCYSQRLAERNNKKEYHTIIGKNEVLIPEILQPLGYSTAAMGKWHIAGCGRQTVKTDEKKEGLERFSLVDREIMPCQKGFDYYFGIPYSNDMRPPVLMQNNEIIEEIGHGEKQRGITTRYTDEAISFIENNKNKPFFLYLAHNMPHTPLWPGKEFEGKSDYGFYGDCVEEIDWNVGRILDKLDELNLDENTVVIYITDNGPWVDPSKGHFQDSTSSRLQGGNADPLRGYKVTSWDGGWRVPCIVRYPSKVKAGIVSDEFITSMELLPTITRLAGAKIPADRKIDGYDITNLLTGKSKKSPRKDFYFYRWTHLHAVRDGEWKLVLPREAKPADLGWYNRIQEEVTEILLFNLKEDIGETTNVAAQYPEVVKRMMEIVEEAQADLGDASRDIVGNGVRKINI